MLSRVPEFSTPSFFRAGLQQICSGDAERTAQQQPAGGTAEPVKGCQQAPGRQIADGREARGSVTAGGELPDRNWRRSSLTDQASLPGCEICNIGWQNLQRLWQQQSLFPGSHSPSAGGHSPCQPLAVQRTSQCPWRASLRFPACPAAAADPAGWPQSHTGRSLSVSLQFRYRNGRFCRFGRDCDVIPVIRQGQISGSGRRKSAAVLFVRCGETLQGPAPLWTDTTRNKGTAVSSGTATALRLP